MIDIAPLVPAGARSVIHRGRDTERRHGRIHFFVALPRLRIKRNSKRRWLPYVALIPVGAALFYFAIPRPLARYDFLNRFDPVIEEMHLPIVQVNQPLPAGDPKQWVYRFRAGDADAILDLLEERLSAQGFIATEADDGNGQVHIKLVQPQTTQGHTVSFLTGADASIYACRMTDPDHPKNEAEAGERGLCVVVVETNDSWLETRIRALGHFLRR